MLLKSSLKAPKKGSVLIWFLVLIVSVAPKEFFSHCNSAFRDGNSNFKIARMEYTVSEEQKFSIWLPQKWTAEMISEPSLMGIWLETRKVSNAANEIQANETTRGVVARLYSKRVHLSHWYPHALLWCGFNWFVVRENVECSNSLKTWTTTKFFLYVPCLRRYWETRSYRRNLRVYLRPLRDRFSEVFNQKRHGHIYPLVVEGQVTTWLNINIKPGTLRNYRQATRLFKLPLKNTSRPNSCYSDCNGQDGYRPVSGFRLFAWSIPPMEQPMVNSDKKLGWGWWALLIGGIAAVECGALFIFGLARMIDDGLPVRIGLFLIGASLVLLIFGASMLRHAFLRVNSPNRDIVSHKVLTQSYFPYYTKYMANVLSTDKQAGIIGALCEGSSIRSIERMTGVHRDTIMRLGVRVGQGCMALMDAKMRNLSCTRLEMDEIWGFVGKKQKNIEVEDDPSLGDVWTFCAIDADTKLVPAFMVGKRDKATANAFVDDIAGRMNNRLQISTDGLAAYVEAIAGAFGNDVDYAQIIKTYGKVEVTNNRRYSAPDFVSSEKVVVIGNPDNDLISTSYVERLNATTRLHMRRLTRLTLAFSKKLDNFEAAVGLHFAYYNFVKRHNTVKCTPAMAAGVTATQWTVEDLVKAA